MTVQGRAKKILAKLSDKCSDRADGLCIGCLDQWAERGREDSNMLEFFFHNPVDSIATDMYLEAIFDSKT